MTRRIKILLFVLFLLSTNSYAQKFFLPDSLSKPIKLPGKFSLEPRSSFEIGQKSSYRYVVTDTALYYSIFKNYSRDSLPVIDFTIHELLLYVYCRQCLASCPDNEPCHRNGCRYTYTWYILKKT